MPRAAAPTLSLSSQHGPVQRSAIARVTGLSPASVTDHHLPLPGGTEPCGCGRIGCLQAELSERTLCRRAGRPGWSTG